MIKRFNRFELKYLVPNTTRDPLVNELTAHVVPDPEGGERGIYRVTSMYYDSPDLACFRAKIDGIKFRRKLRIRRYGELGDATSEVMVEVKQRINRTTQKRRLPLPLHDALTLCAGRLERTWSDERDALVAGEVEFLVRSLLLNPTCVVGYLRQAFMGGRYEPGLRITFDQGLWCNAAAAGLNDTARHAILPPDWLVMEVKANHAIPLWVSHLLARHGVSLTRFSKYCAGVTHLHELGIVQAPAAWDAQRGAENG